MRLFDEVKQGEGSDAGGGAGADAAAKAAADKATADAATKAASDKAAADKAAADKVTADAAAKAAADKAAAQGAPAEYKFTVPDGHEMDAEITTEFTGIAKKHKLTQEAASEIYAIGGKLAAKQAGALKTFIDKTRGDWVAEIKADPALGGANFDASLGVAKKAIDWVDPSGKLKKYLDDSGAGDNPSLVRAFHKFGKAISNDKLVVGGSGEGQGQSAIFSYPNSKHNA